MNPNYKRKIRTEIREIGVVGVNINLDLVRVQNLAHLRDRIKERNAPSIEEVENILNEVVKVLDFIVGGIQSPLAKGLWDNLEEPKANNEL